MKEVKRSILKAYANDEISEQQAFDGLVENGYSRADAMFRIMEWRDSDSDVLDGGNLYDDDGEILVDAGEIETDYGNINAGIYESLDGNIQVWVAENPFGKPYVYFNRKSSTETQAIPLDAAEAIAEALKELKGDN